MKHEYKNFVFILIFLIMSSMFGCTSEKIYRVKHESEVKSSKNINDLSYTLSSEYVDNLDTLIINYEKEFQSISEKNKKAKKNISLNILDEILEPLSNIVLNEKYLRDPEFFGKEEKNLTKLLTLFNKALILVHENYSEVLYKNSILEKYETIVFSDCSKSLDGCVNIWYFIRDNHSSLVLKIIADIIDENLDEYEKKDQKAFSDEIEHYYRVLKMIYTLKNRRLDSDLEFMWIKRARDYIVYYDGLDQTEKKVENETHLFVFNTIINQYVPNEPSKNTRFKSFIENFKPWSYSRLEWDVFGSSTPKIFALGAKYYQNEHDIKNTVNYTQSKNDHVGKPFIDRVNELYEKNSTLFSYIDIDFNDFRLDKLQNVYFLMVDRTFRGHLNEKDAAYLWEGSNKDSEALLSTIDKYLKVEVIRQIEKTNSFMIDIFTRDDLDNDKLFNTVLDHSKNKTQDFERLLSRIDSIKSLMDLVFNSSKPLSQYVEIKSSIERLRSNIKFYSVYPNMMLMSYFLAKLDSNLKLRTWFGTSIEIIPSSVISYFFDGKWSPWFLFGNDLLKLDRFEILFSYHFALKTGAFETYENSKKVDTITEDFTKLDFFRTLIGGFLNDMKNSLNTELSKLNDKIIKHTSKSQFEKLCENPYQHSFEIPFADIDSYVFFGAGDRGPGKVAYDFFGGSYPSLLNQYRIDNGRKIKYVKTMIGILEDHLLASKSNLNESGRFDSEMDDLSKMKKFLDEILELRDDFVTKIADSYADFAECFRDAQKIESKRQFDLIENEIEHLEKVYENMRALRNGEKPQYLIQTNLDEITPDYYSYSKFDLMLRIKNSLESIGLVKVNMPEKKHLDDLSYVKNITRHPIPFNESKEDFIKSALNYLSSRDAKSFLNWFSSTGARSMKHLRSQQKLLVQLYKYGKIGKIRESVNCYGTDRNVCENYRNEFILFDEIFDIVSVLNISPEESILLHKLSLNSKYELDTMKNFIIDSTNNTIVPFFDTTFDSLGDESGNGNDNLLDEAENLVSSMRAIDHFLFPPNRKIFRIIRNNYRDIVTDYESRFERFNDVIDIIESSFEFRIPDFTLDIGLNGERNTFQIVDSNGTPKIISEIKRINIDRKVRSFHRNTTDFYLPYEGDIECIGVDAPESCSFELIDISKVSK